MIRVATAINNFLPEQEAYVLPIEETVFVLTFPQLQEIVSRVVQEATEPLQKRVQALEATQDVQAENELNMLRLINDLRNELCHTQPLQRDRGEILKALIAVNGGKMLAKDARKKMHLSRSAFSQLLATMKDSIEVKPYHLRKNQKVLNLV